MFCVIGAAIAASLPVRWATLGELAVVWLAAPIVAFGAGFALTRLLDLAVPRHAANHQARRQIEAVDAGTGARSGLAAWFPGASLSLPGGVRREAERVQALVVVLAVSQGLFTSMNQALIAAMAGTGLARGRETVKRRQLFGILRGWVVGPAAGFALAYLTEVLVRALGG